MKSRGFTVKLFTVVSVVFLSGYCITMGLGFAGAWVAPFAKELEIAGMVSFFGAILSLVGFIVALNREGR